MFQSEAYWDQTDASKRNFDLFKPTDNRAGQHEHHGNHFCYEQCHALRTAGCIMVQGIFVLVHV